LGDTFEFSITDPGEIPEGATPVATLEGYPNIEVRVRTEIFKKTLQKDGSKKRNRYHHGLIAQEVSRVIQDTGVDFGGFQWHAHNGGSDVYTLGYSELIAPLIKAVQELSQANAEIRAELAAVKAKVS
jgi:hypothetical protein